MRCRLLRAGQRFRSDAGELPGRPDIVFAQSRVAIFVDGDFWHGRNLKKRLARLRAGHNASYWLAKIQSNCARDRRTRAALRRLGWQVIRAWETDIQRDVERVAQKILSAVILRRGAMAKSRQAVARKRAKAA